MKIERKKYLMLKKMIKDKKNHSLEYKYDFIGIILRYFYIPITFKNKYVCSYFIADLLAMIGLGAATTGTQGCYVFFTDEPKMPSCLIEK